MDEEKARGVEIRSPLDAADRQYVRLIVFIVFIVMYGYISNSWKTVLSKALVRPFKMFIYEPIVQLLGVYMAFVYGLLYSTHSESLSCVSGLTHYSISYDHTYDVPGRVS
jgi:hypothetical protein